MPGSLLGCIHHRFDWRTCLIWRHSRNNTLSENVFVVKLSAPDIILPGLQLSIHWEFPGRESRRHQTGRRIAGHVLLEIGFWYNKSMKSRFQVTLSLLAWLLLITGTAWNAPSPAAAGGLSLVSPSACPPGGCAAGQRLNFTVQYDLGTYDSPSGNNPNAIVCFYAPTNWAVSQIDVGATGVLTGSPYTYTQTNQTGCDPAPATPTQYTFLGKASAALQPGSFGDSLRFAFRLGASATSSSSILVRAYDLESGAWVQKLQTFQTVSVAAAASPAFVASDPSSCNNNNPCYVNSGDDLPGGVGTGLKDALDALPAGSQIRILGTYPIKSQTVLAAQPQVIQGLNHGTVTYSGTSCAGAMLDLQAGVTIQNLAIDSGSCSTPRSLIQVDTTQAVSIESSDLTGGGNAIDVKPSGAHLTARFNQISGNQGYAIWLEAGDSSLYAVANNLVGNNPGKPQVACGQNSLASLSHNFWGTGQLPSTSVSGCYVSDAARLGAAVLHNPSGPGVDAREMTVTKDKTYSPDNQVALQHPQGENDFAIYLINHGSRTDSAPFQNGSSAPLTACSNYWDIFLIDGALVSNGGSLEAYFKYDLNNTCIATVESTSYCASTDPGPRIPLLWYDLTSNSWGMTSNQATACDTNNNEIQVTLGGSGKPAFPGDLVFTPFVVGYQPDNVVLTSFIATGGNAQVAVQWQTASEQNISGFYLQRSAQSGGPYQRLQFFPSIGNTQFGGMYQYLDTNLTNGSTYYYRLEYINKTDGFSSFSGAISAVPSAPTPTPTQTATPTTSATPTGTVTPTGTITPTGSVTPTRTNTPTPTSTLSPTRTPTPTATVYYYYSSTSTRTPTRTSTVTGGGSGYPGPVQSATPSPPAGSGKTGYPSPEQSLSAAAGSSGAEQGGTAYPAAQSGGAGAAAPTGAAQPSGTPSLSPGAAIASASGQTGGPGSPSQAPAAGTALWLSLGFGALAAVLAVSIGGWLLFIHRGIQ